MQSVLKRSCQSNDSGRGLRPCDITFEKEIKILVDKKKTTGWICHDRVVVYTLPTCISVQTTCKSVYDPFNRN